VTTRPQNSRVVSALRPTKKRDKRPRARGRSPAST